MKHHHALRISSPHHLYTFCIIGFIFTLHAALPAYINSTFLNQFASEQTVSLLYIISSVVTVLSFLFLYKILSKIGNYRMTMVLFFLQIIMLSALIVGNSVWVIAPVFILSLLVVNILSINFDIFLEDETHTRNTGGVRGIFFTATSAAWILSPLLAGSLIQGNQYWAVYAGALFLILPCIYIVKKNFKNFKDVQYSHATLQATAHKVFYDKDLKKIFIANLILQSFYAWMVVYTPIYLNKYVGFGWDDIGLIFTIMLLPFVIVDYPLGELADKKYGEKEIMSAGFFILGVATIALAFIDKPNIWMWILALFMTRVGAASVEIMIETYFFKKVPERDLNILGFFRITRPAAYIIAPVIATIALTTVGHQGMYVILGIFCLCGLFFSLTIKDTM